MIVLKPFQAVKWTLGVFGSEKSFLANPILGSERLNRMGLHRSRVAAAARMAELRRRAMIWSVPRADREAYDRDGFVVHEDFLPAELFERLRAEVLERAHPAYEMRQGSTVTRMTPIVAGDMPVAASVAADPALRALAGYVAGRGGAPVTFVQTVIAEPQADAPDPQTDLHADTFHSTAKYWLFLHDVPDNAGPFVFVPGSHRLTPERLDWEYRQSLTARSDARAHHSFGSFRISPDRLADLGYAAPRRMAVRANTLVVADTYGFHNRAPSDHPTTRVELHGHMRRNPFMPWNGGDPLGLPGVRGNQLALYHWWRGVGARFGKPRVWTPVGAVTGDAPARV